jgi:hypothetical protein
MAGLGAGGLQPMFRPLVWQGVARRRRGGTVEIGILGNGSSSIGPLRAIRHRIPASLLIGRVATREFPTPNNGRCEGSACSAFEELGARASGSGRSGCRAEVATAVERLVHHDRRQAPAVFGISMPPRWRAYWGGTFASLADRNSLPRVDMGAAGVEPSLLSRARVGEVPSF